MFRHYNEPWHLSDDAALHVAKLAKIPDHNHDAFCRDICGYVQMVCEWDSRSAVSYRPSKNLKDAANAARALRAAAQALTDDDKQWVQKVVAQHKYLDGRPNPLLDLNWTALVVAQVLNLAASGRGLLNSFGPIDCKPPRKRGRKRGSVNDKTFHELIDLILHAAYSYDGKLTFDKNSQRGSLVNVLEFLRPHVPRGVIPKALPYNTIQKIKTKFSP